MAEGAEEVYIPGPRRKTVKEREEIRARMYGYWNEFYKQDTESKTARVFLERLEDPESLFNNEEWLQKTIDEIEAERGVKNSRWKVEK